MWSETFSEDYCVTSGITNCDGLQYNVFAKAKLGERVVKTA